jgi:RimJ/RimL family protein N-acetyltransferase
VIETERLVLRAAEERDRALLEGLWCDADVMADLMPPVSQAESRAIADAVIRRLGLIGAPAPYGTWVIEARASGAAVGICGLKPGDAGTPIAGEVEIGWILARTAWSHGYAQEAGAACIRWCWTHSDARAIVAMTPARNARSARLVTRLGLAHVADGDFLHPELAPDHPLCAHQIYRLARPAAPIIAQA